MTLSRLPLTYRLFGAIGLTALLAVVILAALVAVAMRDGFSRYLLRDELELHAPLADALAAAYDPRAGGWPDLQGNPRAWRRFVAEHDPRPPDRPAPPAPFDRPPPKPIDERLVLLDATRNPVVGTRPDPGQDREVMPIRAAQAPKDAAPIGWLGILSPGNIQNATDAIFLRSQFRSLALAAGLALLLSGLVAALLARHFLGPIRALARGAKRLADGEYSARIPRDREDELGQLVDHYNALAETLERAERAQRQWVSDTSHELQTPLAVLRAHIEAVQDGVRPADAATLGAMADAVARLSRLVTDLRLLSAWREDSLVADRRPTDLTRIARAAVDAVHPGFTASGIDLTTEIAGPVLVDCDAGRFRQVIDNLLANTLRYTDAPGTARLRVWASGTLAYLTLDDTVPAPPESSMPHLFDRFHRADASRSRASGGSGLGLAICKAIVEAHGGTISAAPSREGGLHVEMTLPLGERP